MNIEKAVSFTSVSSLEYQQHKNYRSAQLKLSLKQDNV